MLSNITTITKLEISLELGIKFNLEMERMSVSMLLIELPKKEDSFLPEI
jgi:hypothetical protein